MAKLNENYLNIKQSYLFSEIAKRVDDYTAANPDKKIIRLGIGDVTQPLGSLVIEALHKAVDEMSKAERAYRLIIKETAYKLTQTRYLFRTAQKATRAT